MNIEKLNSPIGYLEFVLHGYPTKETARKLFDALDFQRACQAYLDFIPAMSMYSLLEGQEKGWGCKECSDLAVAADLMDATPLVLTGNTESVYFACNVDLKKDGDYLDGSQTYKLHLPPNIPINNFWSVTLYDPMTRSMLQNGMPKPSINSFDDPEQNEDGSYDVFFGPEAPAGREKNWVKTVPGKGWFTYIRLYGPLEAFFEQTWKPDDIVKV